MPNGYSSNIQSLVSIKDLKLVRLTSRDCHALRQQLLPAPLSIPHGVMTIVGNVVGAFIVWSKKLVTLNTRICC